MKKKTIASKVSCSGIGLHSGDIINVSLCPETSNTGIRFKRIDLQPEVIIPADCGHVTATTRSTTLALNDVSVTTVEHLMAALASFGIDNLTIEIDGAEMPILDGSALPFVEMIQSAGIQDSEDDKDCFIIEEPFVLNDPSIGAEIIALPSDKFEVSVMVDYKGSTINQQYAKLDDIANFASEIAPCRTFVFTNELEILHDNGLIKGGDLNNAVVLAEYGLTQERLDFLSKKWGIDPKPLPADNIINDKKLFFENEQARHKLLDLIGDLNLLGKSIKGKIIATKPGHKINTEFAKLLKKKYLEQRKLKGKPIYNPEDEPVMDIEKIKSMLPHRYPFLLVDKIISLSEGHVVGIKNVTINEEFFLGHFPGNPVFPGVLQMEALAQTGGLLALSSVPDPSNWDTYFLKMDNVKFKSKVVPGDTLILKMELITPIRRGIVHMMGTAYVGNKIVSEGELTAQIVRREN